MSLHEVPIAVRRLWIVTESRQGGAEPEIDAFKLIFCKHFWLVETFGPLLQ